MTVPAVACAGARLASAIRRRRSGALDRASARGYVRAAMVEHENPFGRLIGLRVDEMTAGRSRCSLAVEARHLNPNGVVHGAVVYALADTGMGAALYSTLAEGEAGATVEIKINYLAAQRDGTLECETSLVHRTGRLAVLESRVRAAGDLVAIALGTYSVFARRG